MITTSYGEEFSKTITLLSKKIEDVTKGNNETNQLIGYNQDKELKPQTAEVDKDNKIETIKVDPGQKVKNIEKAKTKRGNSKNSG